MNATLLSIKRLLAPMLILMLMLAACSAPAETPAESEPEESSTSTESSSESESEAAETSEDESMAETGPILLGHLTYHTGAFGAFGEFFDEVTDFTLDIINENPPLGREMVSIHQDIGTIGEAQAARKLIDSEGVHILLNAAHEYGSYRDWMLDYQAENGSPLMPSVHGGAIEREIGGDPAEPLFRGSPMDSALGVASVYQAYQEGAKSIAIVAAEIAGSQLQKDAAISAAEQLGMEVVEIVDIQPEQPTYRSEISKVESANPDAVIMFSPPEEGGTFVKNSAEAGLSLLIIGTNEWQELEFMNTATMDAINQHQLVGIISFAHAESPAWAFFEPQWNDNGKPDLGAADNSYTMQYYDLLVVTALAIEQAGSTDSADWVKAVPAVTSGGEKVYTYEEGVVAIRAGKDIDYSGVTGEVSYTDTGVVSGLFGLFEYKSEDNLEFIGAMSDEIILALDAGNFSPDMEESSDAGGEAMAMSDEPILLGHLTYHTGAFGAFGEFFDRVTDFTIDIINEDPPLGREIVAIHQDIGTIGEAQASRKLIDSEGVDLLLNTAHEYGSYRDWMLDHQAENDGPLMPSVHGGAIEREIGGIASEPLFRGSPMDTALGVSAVLQAAEAGATSIVIVAAEIAGSQLQRDAAVSGAEQLGIEVLEIIDVQPEQPTYRSEISKIERASADALIMFSPPEEGGTVVKNAAEAGLSLTIIGTNEWQEQEFVNTATMDAINQHKLVGIVGFAHADSPAWDYFEPLWTNSGHADLGGADNSYTMQYYDLLVVSALAIELAGSTNSSDWVLAVPAVTDPPGKSVYTYAEGIEAIRNGEDIDYSGVTGEFSYTDTGVVSGLFGMLQWTSADNIELVSTMDDQDILALDAGTYQR